MLNTVAKWAERIERKMGWTIYKIVNNPVNQMVNVIFNDGDTGRKYTVKKENDHYEAWTMIGRVAYTAKGKDIQETLDVMENTICVIQ